MVTFRFLPALILSSKADLGSGACVTVVLGTTAPIGGTIAPIGGIGGGGALKSFIGGGGGGAVALLIGGGSGADDKL